MEISFSQAYDIVEKAFYWNRTNPDFLYNANQKHHIISIAIANLCFHFEDSSLATREKLLNLFIEAYRQFEILDERSKREVSLNEDKLRTEVIDDYQNLDEELELFLDQESYYMNFLLEGIV